MAGISTLKLKAFEEVCDTPARRHYTIKCDQDIFID